MPVPGLIIPGSSGLVYYASSGDAGLDLFAALGSPAGPVVYEFYVAAGVALGAPDVTTPALDATGFHADTVGYWFIDPLGEIQGHGGVGGVGSDPESNPGGGGGGGGGAGRLVGTGGAAGGDLGVAGSDGDLVGGGGAGGATDTSDPVTFLTVGDGGVGGDAVHLNHAVTIANAGAIWGGGGGGAGGWYQGTLPPAYGRNGGAGGDAGLSGNFGTQIGTVLGDLSFGGDAGWAIRYSGSGGTTFSPVAGGLDPLLKGVVG